MIGRALAAAIRGESGARDGGDAPRAVGDGLEAVPSVDARASRPVGMPLLVLAASLVLLLASGLWHLGGRAFGRRSGPDG